MQAFYFISGSEAVDYYLVIPAYQNFFTLAMI